MLVSIVFTLLVAPVVADEVVSSEKADFRIEQISDGLEHPWAVAFMPDGGYLVSERRGTLRRIDAAGRLKPDPIGGLPRISQHGQGGLLDVVLHPDFTTNRWVYFSFAEPGDGGFGTSVGRGRLDGDQLTDVEVIFRMRPKSGAGRHFGSRLVFDQHGMLFITLGDRGDRPRSQALDDHAGSVIRLHDDGRVPSNNPFVGRSDALPEIYSYGHRNIQGAVLDPRSGRLWTHEHGPQGGDEINIPRPGANYGWPVITYGVNYFTGTSIGEGQAKPGMEQPLYQWTPSIAPSGMALYEGTAFPGWQGNLFVGALKTRELVRLELSDQEVVHEERLLTGRLGRIRDVRLGPDGLLYLLTDANNGRLVRLVPAG
ncbi:MAG: PQQ-dependent sugar dehydrogenase [Chromatiaceae bacterium]|jgi:glucose/arabinose dehydrogenase